MDGVSDRFKASPYTGLHKNNAAFNRATSGIGTFDPSVQAVEKIKVLRVQCYLHWNLFSWRNVGISFQIHICRTIDHNKNCVGRGRFLAVGLNVSLACRLTSELDADDGRSAVCFCLLWSGGWRGARNLGEAYSTGGVHSRSVTAVTVSLTASDFSHARRIWAPPLTSPCKSNC
jgi:hypothetical protein